MDIKINNIDKRVKIYVCDFFKINELYNYFNKLDLFLYLVWKDGFIYNLNVYIIELFNYYLFINKLI